MEGKKRIHPTQKPVGLFELILQDFAGSGNLIADPCLGSGTTLIACERTGCLGIGVEVDPAYVAVTLQRLKDLGLEPKLAEVVNQPQFTDKTAT